MAGGPGVFLRASVMTGWFADVVQRLLCFVAFVRSRRTGHFSGMCMACVGCVSGMFPACSKHVSGIDLACFEHVSGMFRHLNCLCVSFVRSSVVHDFHVSIFPICSICLGPRIFAESR